MPDKSNFPTFDELMWPTLVALKALGGSGSNEEIVDKIIEIEKVPSDKQEVMSTSGNMTKLEYRSAWARTYLKFAGAVENGVRGIWSLTKLGESASAYEMDALLKKARANQKVLKPASKQKENEGESLNPIAEAEDWRESLLDILHVMPPTDFERLCQRLLRESGFVRVEVTGKAGDGGIDGTGVLRMNLLSFHVLFQCKRYSGSVGSSVIRDFRGAMVGRADKGLVITTGTFTSEARKESARDGAPAIDLIDGNDLCELLKSLKLGVDVKLVEEVSIDNNWFKNF